MASRLATMGKPKPEQDEKGRFISGNSGGGRPKGSRNQLGEAFIDDLYADWLAHGVATIEKVRAAKPAAYLKVIASMVPKDLNMKVSAIESMTDDELKASFYRATACRCRGKRRIGANGALGLPVRHCPDGSGGHPAFEPVCDK
jgi:hypothetical protein